ncbi:MAG TPA: bifunctional diguanylate cyclase/phosphodiesterase [Mycobacteriales bacterium]|nr:bifunctional diguanylate cyclase/phosphodiesterase [Mycobacteriales bacterium]
MSSQDEARNVAPASGEHAFWAYLSAVTVAGFALLAWQLTLLHSADLKDMGTAFIVIAIMVIIGEVRPLVVTGVGDVTGVTTSTAFTFALLLHTGLPVALVLQACATVAAAMAYRRAVWRTAFNVAQFTLSYGAADVVLLLCGRHASITHMLGVKGSDLPSIALAAVVYFVINNSFVSTALALKNRTTVQHEFFSDFAFQVLSNAALLGIAPIVVIVVETSSAMVPLLLFPLAAVYATAAMMRTRERESMHDPLTGLPNRTLMTDRTADAVAAAAEAGHHVALFLLDLDRFKEINDTLGHRVGDELLQLVGRRLTAALRPGDVIGRLGGDEFAMLVPNLEDPRAAVDLAERVRMSLVEPFHYDGLSHEIDGSIGVAIYPAHGSDFETLLQRADVAMYVAKGRGTGVQLYSTEIDRHSTLRLSMLAELRTALENDDLELHYQPKADLRTGDVVGVEALLRWRHPERGLIQPDDFLPLAAQTGLMRLITKFVLEQALCQLSVWWRMGIKVHAAVNVSALDLYDRGFAELLQRNIEQHDVPPRALMIEVTESILMADPARAASTLLALAGLGVGVSLDDFGTGYSSLVHLKRLPVSEVKIDKSFVMRMDVNEDDAAIVRSIIDLAGALGLRTVAEGVETRDAWDRLAVYGCDAAQGWYLAKGMPADVATEWLQNVRHVGSSPASDGRVLPSARSARLGVARG